MENLTPMMAQYKRLKDNALKLLVLKFTKINIGAIC